MNYRINPKNNDSISQLGRGCMRFPRKGGQIDMEKAAAIISRAIDRGVNYFDTAYIYPGSEEALGQVLFDLNARDKVFVSTKLPVYLCRKTADFQRFFEKQLARLKTDRIDYYFMHMLGDTQAWQRLCDLGIEDWIAAKKTSGEIVNIGFSFHGGRPAFESLLDVYEWDFAMIQYNYLDENNQAGYSGLHKAASMQMPVFIMEPLRGGLLANTLPKGAQAVFNNLDADISPAQWGLRWVWNHSDVTMLLSGMSAVEQVDENAAAAQMLPETLTAQELAAYKEVTAIFNGVIKIPCTGCCYCVPCPAGVDIPGCFSCYNESFAQSRGAAIAKYYKQGGSLAGKLSGASQCKRCGLCEGKCPQSIPIMQYLRKTNSRMLGPVAEPIIKLVRRVMRLNVKS